MRIRDRAVSEIMQRHVAIAAPDERLDLVDDIMRLGRVRHMPVVERERLVGMLSSHDVLAASLAKVFDVEETHRRTFLRAVDVREVMVKPVTTLPPEATLREAAELIVTRKIGCVAVVGPDERLLGLVTTTDLIRAALLEEPADESDAVVVVEEKKMTDVGKRIERELERELAELRRVRDELRVRVHLAKSEVKQLWDGLERKLSKLESEAKRVSKRAEEPLGEIGAAARLLIDEIRDGYRRVRDSL
jgi:CBS domain-containing protein